MANTTVKSEQIEDGSITADKIADGAIVATELADNAVTTAKINADAVTGAKIADDAINSEHYTDGSIDTAHIADDQVTQAKIADDAVGADQLAASAVVTASIVDDNVTTAKIADGNISTALLADTAVTSAKLANNIDIAGTFDVTGATTLDAALTVAGNVGIGTTTPNQWASYTDSAATVLNVTDSSQRARLVAQGGNGAHLDLVDSGGGSDDKHLNLSVDGGIGKFGSLNDAGNAWVKENILIMDIGSGNVGIGTASPSVASGLGLVLNGGSAQTRIALKNDTTGDASGDGVQIALVSDDLLIQNRESSGIITFQTGDSERVRLDASGKVGIGTTSPSVPLHITEAGSDGYEDMLKIERTHASSTAAGVVFHLTGTGGTAQATAIFVEQQEDWSSGTSRSSNLQMQAKIDGTDRNHIQVGSFGDGTSEIRLSTMDSIRIKADSAGHVTMPATAAFLARPSGGQNNLAVNVDHTISFGTEIFDQNADFASHTFTAPVTGKYQLNASVQFYDSDSATAYHHVKIITSNRAYQNIASLNKMSGDPAYWTFNISVLADMDANDTAYVMVAIPNTGSAQADITTESFFSGFLAC